MKTYHRSMPIILLLASLILGGAGCSREAKRDNHLKRANRYFDSKQYDRAEVEYMNVLRLEPTNSQAIHRLGTSRYNSGNVAGSFPLLLKSAQLEPDDLETRAKLGLIYLASRQYKKARTEAEFILAKQPTHSTAILLLSDTAFLATEIAETKQRLEQLLKQAAGDKAPLLMALGNLYLRQRDLKGAEESFKQAQALDPESSGTYLSLGQLYLLRNDLGEAENAFKKAADLSPTNSGARLRYADFKFKTGDKEEAKQILKEISEKVPDYFPAWLYLAEIALLEKKYDECGDLVKKVLARDSSNLDARVLRARIKLAQGHLDKALEDLERLKAQYPRVPQVHYQLALIQLRNNEISKASSSLEQAVSLDPNYIEAILLLADLNLRRGDSASAMATLSQLVKQHPELVQAHLLLADAYRVRRTLDEAVAVYRKTLELFPKNAQVPLLLGLTLRQQNKIGEARQAFTKTLELAPDNITATAQLVELDVLAKDFPRALARVQAQIAKYPKAPAPRFLLARIQLAQGERDKAETALLTAVELDPNFRAAYLTLAKLYVDSKRHEQALEKLQGIVVKNPRDVAALMQIGMIQEKTGEFGKAAETYEKLLSIKSQFGPALNNLAYIYVEHLGNTNRAFELAQQARKLLPNDPQTADTLGWVLYNRREYSWALSLLQESLEKTRALALPADPEVLLHAGLTHYALGEEALARNTLTRAIELGKDLPVMEKAERCLSVLNMETSPASPEEVRKLEKVLSEQPDDLIALTRLAGVYESLGAIEKARDAYERASRLNPKGVLVLVKLAQLYSERLHESKKALDLARAARNLAPDDPAVAQTLGRLAYQAGDYKWSLSLLQESARKQSDQPEVLYHLAKSYYSLGQVTLAEDAMQRALHMNRAFPNLIDAKRFLAMIDLYNNPKGRNNPEFEVNEILKVDPKHVPALMVSALLQEQRGSYAEAKQIYESILGQTPLFAPAMKHLAILCAEHLPDEQKAFNFAVKSRSLLPEDAEVAKILGKIYYRRGDYANAVVLLKESSRKRTEDADLFYYLGLAHSKRKEKVESKAALGRALALNPGAGFAPEAKRVMDSLQHE